MAVFSLVRRYERYCDNKLLAPMVERSLVKGCPLFRRVRAVVGVAAFVTCVYNQKSYAAAPSLEEIQAQFTQISERIREQKGQLRLLEVRRAQMVATLKGQQSAVQESERKRTRLQEQGKVISLNIATIEARRQATEEGLSRLKAKVRGRIRGIFDLARAQKGLGLFSSMSQRSQANAAKVLFYLSKIRLSDEHTLFQYHSALEVADRELVFLQELSKEKRELDEELTLVTRHLATQVEQQRVTLTSIEADKKVLKASLTELVKEADRLDRIIFRLTGGVTHERIREVSVPKGPSFIGDGAAVPLLPLQGVVTQKFGARKLLGFDDFVLSKGIEVRVSSPSPVVAILDGTIRFAGTMPAFGKVLILDHGGRDYSLYGKLLELQVQIGQKVARGEVLGKVGGTPNDSTLYFEIRRKGTPVDPSRFISF
jgi:murein hydrolase activator